MMQQKPGLIKVPYKLSEVERYSRNAYWIYQNEKPIDVHLNPAYQIDLILSTSILTDCNEPFAHMYGYANVFDLIGKKLCEILPNNPKNFEMLFSFISNNYRLDGAESKELDAFGNYKYFINTVSGIIEDTYLLGAHGFQFEKI